MMKHPIEVYVDAECALGYIRYLGEDAPFDGALPILRDGDGIVRDHAFCDVEYRWDGVHVDVTPDDEVIGFEIIDVDDAECVALAREYAAANDLAFPADIRAAAASRDPAA